MNTKNTKILITAGILIILLAVSGATVLASGGGSVKEKTEYFDIKIEPEKSIFAPDEVMKLKIEVTDKKTGDPVENATIKINMSIYQGHFTEELEIPIENDSVVYEVVQTTIKSNYMISADEAGNGVYVVSKTINTKAELGGISLKVTVEKNGECDTVERAISFMIMNPWVYAIGATLFVVICGLGIGLIFGGVKH